MLKKLSIFLPAILFLFVFSPSKIFAAPPVLPTVYSDSFTGTDGTEFSAYNSDWVPRPLSNIANDYIYNNELVDLGSSAGYYYSPLPNLSDTCETSDFRSDWNGNSWISLETRRNNGEHSYIASISDRYHYAIGKDYTSVVYTTFPDGPLDTNWHSVTFCSIGNVHTLYLDNNYLDSITDSSYPSGYVALDSEVGMHMDNLVISASASTPQLTSLSPAKVWVGLKNSDDIGVKFDLKAEVYADSTLVSSGETDSVTAGSSGFNSAKLDTISFSSFSPVNFPSGTALTLKLYVRNACTGSGHNSGTARLWYSDSQANSLFDATINGNESNYYLIPSAALSTSVGSGPKQTVDVASGAKCSTFKPFGSWSITP